ncbi:MAG: glycosyltransferase family 2 protein [Pseudomonadota bacterium]|uniref:glycosyltransferase family 2 protein n=1 Tax=Roseovarius sp. TaxID=1486281 RepID=UPI00356459FF
MPTHPDKQPLASVLMPAHNAQDWMSRAIRSVCDQRCADWELLIVDDASDDGTWAMARAAASQDSRIRALSSPHRLGAAEARNMALAQARGRFIAFLDTDDAWHPDKLHLQIRFMRETGTALSYTGFWRVRGTREHEVRVPPEITRDGLLRGNVIGCLTAVYDSHAFGKVPMPPLPLRHDFALWLDLLARAGMAQGLTRPLATHYRRKGSLSSHPLRALSATWRLYRRHAALGRASAAMCLSSHVIGRLLRG